MRKIVHDWLKTLDAFWRHQLNRIKGRAEQQTREQNESPANIKQGKDRHEKQ